MMQRIQRKRTKGYRQPPNTRYCGRGTRWGNDWKIGKADWNTGEPMTRDDVLRRFRWTLQSLISLIGWERFGEHYLRPLEGYEYLSCFCPLDEPCHVDIWIEYFEKWKKGI